MIEVTRLECRVRHRAVLRDVSFLVPAGEVLALTGPNGGGKSLLLAVCATLVRPDAGSVRLAGVDAVKDVRAVRRVLGYVPEDVGWAPRTTVREDLAFFAEAHGLISAARRGAIADALTRWSLKPVEDERVDRLSRGVLRRLALARAWLHRPRVLLLDDPMSGLDAESRHVVSTELARHAETGGSALVVAPDVGSLEGIAHTIAALAGGSLRDVRAPAPRATDASHANEPDGVRAGR